MLKVSRHWDRRTALRFRSGDEIRGLGPPDNRQCRTLNAKPYQFRDAAFWYNRIKHGHFPLMTSQ